MNPVLILARLTLREAIRRRIVLAAFLLGVVFLLLYSIGFYMVARAAYTLRENTLQTVINQEGFNTLFLAGLYAINFLTIAIAALLAADSLAGEINSGTIQSIVTKPVRRLDIVLGKWLGFAILLGSYLLLMAGGVILIVWIEVGYVAPNLLAGVGLIYLESLLVMSAALMLSTSFTGLATGAVIFGLYGLAFIGGWVEQIGSFLHSQTAINVGIVTSLIIPSEALWRRAAYEMQSPISGALGISPFGTISVPSALMIVYSAVYMVGAVALALRLFGRRDL
jgi:Cu-processing system permease protein